MALSTGQTPVSTGGTVVCNVPPGPGQVTISNAGTAVVYLGAGAGSASFAAGFPVPSGGFFSFNLFQGSPGALLHAVTNGGSATVGFLISTSYGLAQPGSQ